MQTVTVAMTEHEQRNRVVILGAGSVGKSSILKRFLFDTFSNEYHETVEDLYCREYTYQDTDIHVDFLDTAGNFVFPAMRRLSITTAHAFILVYSITSQQTFEEVKTLWEQIKEVRSNYEDIPCVVIGNKVDLEDNRQVELFDALNWVYNESNCGAFIEVSAKSNECIFDAFKLLFEKTKNPRAHINEPITARRLSEHSPELQGVGDLHPEMSLEHGPVHDDKTCNISRSRSLVRRRSKPKVQKPHVHSQKTEDCVVA